MPRAPKLKVYRTPVGFHDAYVAAPSQKAAAEAWGSDVSLFARGEAERVTDPALTEEPLSRPGEVIKRLRGTAAEQLAALGGSDAPAARKGARSAKSKSAPKPRPSRAALDEAEGKVTAVESRHAGELKVLADREAALARERAVLEKKQGRKMEQVTAQRERARTAYEQAMRRWRE